MAFGTNVCPALAPFPLLLLSLSRCCISSSVTWPLLGYTMEVFPFTTPATEKRENAINTVTNMLEDDTFEGTYFLAATLS